MTLPELSTMITHGFEPKVEVHGVDPSIYLIFCFIDGRRQPLQNSDGESIKCPSRRVALDHLRRVGLRRVDFVHHSAYEEMIGFDHDGAPTEHREAITLHGTATITGG
ncbi:MAG: DUF6482 family protein [Pseudomonadota bacterium]|nr:DUF6482 family protein [Pseudomonadota bacterium]MEC7378699.1 DUF6482 family protein [Pseudomonadota bacterium]MEC7614092.1 DUF6482 family protein [Pseudomonadota bacterium]MED5581909.1 DUF6482 family protein [Pseudomonadota bacterium]